MLILNTINTPLCLATRNDDIPCPYCGCKLKEFLEQMKLHDENCGCEKEKDASL